MLKTIGRIIATIILFICFFWVIGTSFYEFKNDIDLKNPVDVFHIERRADLGNKKPEVAKKEKPEKSVNNKAEKKVANKEKENKFTEKDLDKLVATVRVSKEKPKKEYDRSYYENPYKRYKWQGKSLSRNKYAWHISKYLNSEDPFSYTCPYTGIEITDAQTLDYEHLIPIHYVFVFGDTNWDKETANKYAYDMNIGLDVYNRANRSHGDKGPADWLPDKNRASYCYTWLQIANNYDIAMRKKDIKVCKKEILNDMDNAKMLNQFKNNTKEYKEQQEFIKRYKQKKVGN